MMNKISISPDGNSLIAAHPESGIVYVRKLESGRPDLTHLPFDSRMVLA